MSRILPVQPEEARGPSKDVLAAVGRAFGMVPNATRGMAQSPAVRSSRYVSTMPGTGETLARATLPSSTIGFPQVLSGVGPSRITACRMARVSAARARFDAARSADGHARATAAASRVRIRAAIRPRRFLSRSDAREHVRTSAPPAGVRNNLRPARPLSAREATNESLDFEVSADA